MKENKIVIRLIIIKWLINGRCWYDSRNIKFKYAFIAWGDN